MGAGYLEAQQVASKNVGMCCGGTAEVEKLNSTCFDTMIHLVQCSPSWRIVYRDGQFLQPMSRQLSLSFQQFSDQIHSVWTFSPYGVQALGKLAVCQFSQEARLL